MKKINLYELCMWLGYLALFSIAIGAAFAGGGDYGPQQQAVEIIEHVPEEEWTDYLEWIIPGVVTPIVLFFLGWWFNKRRK